MYICIMSINLFPGAPYIATRAHRRRTTESLTNQRRHPVSTLVWPYLTDHPTVCNISQFPVDTRHSPKCAVRWDRCKHTHKVILRIDQCVGFTTNCPNRMHLLWPASIWRADPASSIHHRLHMSIVVISFFQICNNKDTLRPYLLTKSSHLLLFSHSHSVHSPPVNNRRSRIESKRRQSIVAVSNWNRVEFAALLCACLSNSCFCVFLLEI